MLMPGVIIRFSSAKKASACWKDVTLTRTPAVADSSSWQVKYSRILTTCLALNHLVLCSHCIPLPNILYTSCDFFNNCFCFCFYECKRFCVLVSIPVSPSWPTHECHSLHEGIPLLLHEALPLHERGALVNHEVLPLHKGGPLPLHEPLSLKPRRSRLQ